MKTATRSLNYKLLRVCRRFMSGQTKYSEKPRWIKPDGHETDITVYNSITKCKVPLILKNKNVLRWYMCGPTVYDSAHIGHAATYVKSDIIRRILSDCFDINVITVMSITDIDDKIINRANTTGQNFLEITKHYEQEFFEDMRKLNVVRPQLSCRVTDFIPQIIDFISHIMKRGNAYVTETGSVYFDSSKYNKYGKLSQPAPESTHPEKKSALDFGLWKAAKEGEPFWKSPWGIGRPGWHIECSTIASAAFGNSVDIHSGGIDLIFPHHENEETQSCCYHNVDQWVNYWLHCGHLFLQGDVKMSKSLKNTISIEEFLKNYTANQFRILCLLSHYKNGLEYSDMVMQNAVAVLNKIDNFINDCNSYIAGQFSNATIDEVSLLHCLDETKRKVKIALANNFDTADAMHSLIHLISLGNAMLNNKNETYGSRSITAISAVSNYVSDILLKLGISKSTEVKYDQIDVVENFVKFRNVVRNRAMQQTPKDKILLAACDEARSDLATIGITLKDSKNTTTWNIRKY